MITSCTADIGISGCDDAEGCTYNATYAANGTSVRFTVTVRTDTWVGIGFSLDRFMVSDSYCACDNKHCGVSSAMFDSLISCVCTNVPLPKHVGLLHSQLPKNAGGASLSITTL